MAGTVVALALGGGVCYGIYRCRQAIMDDRDRPENLDLSPAQQEYLDGFTSEHADDPFVTTYTVGADKSLRATTYTRGEFFALAFKACHVLRSSGLWRRQGHLGAPALVGVEEK